LWWAFSPPGGAQAALLGSPHGVRRNERGEKKGGEGEAELVGSDRKKFAFVLILGGGGEKEKKKRRRPDGARGKKKKEIHSFPIVRIDYSVVLVRDEKKRPLRPEGGVTAPVLELSSPAEGKKGKRRATARRSMPARN